MLLLDAPVPVSRLLEVHEVAFYLKCSIETVRRAIRTGQLAVVHLGKRSLRIDPVDLQAFIDAQRVPVVPAIAQIPTGDRRRPTSVGHTMRAVDQVG